jgi:ABC-type branched-subunit amino acid transport system ATPase component
MRGAMDADNDDSAATWTASLRTLVEQVPVAGLDVIADGGVYAVIGPTGVGKTTSIAKLAAQAALQFGPGPVGLVTTDAQSLTEALAARANRQRVPEDLYLVRNRQTWLAKMAVELMRRDGRVIDADTLARNFSEVATHAYA